MNLLSKVSAHYIRRYSDEKEICEQWLADNRELDKTLVYEKTKLYLAVIDLWIEIWSAFSPA